MKGTEIRKRVRQFEAPREAGIDITGRTSKTLDVFQGRRFDWVVTVRERANESCETGRSPSITPVASSPVAPMAR